HHIGFWKGDRSNRPANLLTACITCHVPANHLEGAKLWGLKPSSKGFKEATFMSMVRWRLVNLLNCNHSYGYVTKSKRTALGLDKSHANDAFVIAGGENQKRAKAIMFKQIRRNNRSLEKFYDAKYIDIRTSNKVSGQDLFNGRRCRNKNLNEENLHKFRGKKLSKGRRSIRTKRYFYQPNDLVKLDGNIYTVKGTQNKGAYVALKNHSKVVRVELLTPYKFMSGLVAI
ncbi:MAG: paclitaxel/taxanoid biosynthesis susceptibility protein TS1, partial [Epulopiscium sp.]|nr:paclitaxel/taxanoid biosynthesis susceptibility protein TS1 [Candidatus Epulonipiscium sp.]